MGQRCRASRVSFLAFASFCSLPLFTLLFCEKGQNRPRSQPHRPKVSIDLRCQHPRHRPHDGIASGDLFLPSLVANIRRRSGPIEEALEFFFSPTSKKRGGNASESQPHVDSSRQDQRRLATEHEEHIARCPCVATRRSTRHPAESRLVFASPPPLLLWHRRRSRTGGFERFSDGLGKASCG